MEKHSKRLTKKTLESFVVSPPDENDIDACLTNIYQDMDGNIPDMKQISIKKSNPFLRVLGFLFGLSVVCALLAWAGFLYLPKAGNIENNILFEIQGPKEVAMGATTTYTLVYGNKYDAPVKNASLSIYYPEGFVFVTSSKPASNNGNTEWKIGTLSADEEGRLTIVGKYYGSTNDQKTWRSFFNYRPNNFNSELQVITTLTAKINGNPYTLELTGSDTVAVGNDAFYTFTITKTTDSNQPVQLTVVPPENFLITSSTPALKNNKITINWSNTSTPHTAKVTLKGKYKSASGAPLKGVLYLPTSNNQLFMLTSAELATVLQKSNLEFGVAINGSTNDFDAKPGDDLTITVHLKNTSGEEIKNAAIELSFDAPSLKRLSALNWGGVSDKADGTIVGEQITDSLRRGTITWNSKKIPALAKIKADGEITINLKLPLKDAQDFDYSSLKETLIKVNSSVDYLDSKAITKSTAGSPIAITLVSDLAFSGRDTVSVNGQNKEEHAVVWTLTNTFHPLKNITATAEVYGDTTFLTGDSSLGKAEYDPRTKKITWIIVELDQDDTEITNNFTLVINTKNPTQNTLLSKVTIEAEDALTGKKITIVGKEITLK